MFSLSTDLDIKRLLTEHEVCMGKYESEVLTVQTEGRMLLLIWKKYENLIIVMVTVWDVRPEISQSERVLLLPYNTHLGLHSLLLHICNNWFRCSSYPLVMDVACLHPSRSCKFISHSIFSIFGSDAACTSTVCGQRITEKLKMEDKKTKTEYIILIIFFWQCVP